MVVDPTVRGRPLQQGDLSMACATKVSRVRNSQLDNCKCNSLAFCHLKLNKLVSPVRQPMWRVNNCILSKSWIFANF